MEKTYDLKVKAPPRPGFPGFWSAQRHFPGGQLVELKGISGRELKELLADDAAGFLMVEDSDSLRKDLENDPDIDSGGSVQVTVTAEDAAALERIRASRLQAAAAPAAAVPAPPPKPEDKGKGK